MIINPFISFPAASGLTYVGSDIGTGVDATIPGAAAAGDFAFVVNSTTNSNVPSGWTGGANNGSTYASRILSAGDISAGTVTCALVSGNYILTVYRGPGTTLTVKAFGAENNSGVHPMAVSGFVKDGSSKGLIHLVTGRSSLTPVTPPSGWTLRNSNTTSFAYDIIPSTSYVDNTVLDFEYTGTKVIFSTAWEIT